MHKQFALRSQRDMRKCRYSRLLSFEKWVGFEKVQKEKKGLLGRPHIVNKNSGALKGVGFVQK